MKKKNIKELSCSRVEEFLQKREHESALLTSLEEQQLKSHLQACEKCLRYQKFLDNLPAVLSVEEVDLAPASQIRKRIVHEIDKKHENAPVNFLNFLNCRIPVYQILGAAALLIIMFFGVTHQNFLSSEEPGGLTAVEKPFLDSLNVMMNSIRYLEKQKLGRNLKGDSLLLQFVVTSFDIAASVNDTARGEMSRNDSSRSQHSF